MNENLHEDPPPSARPHPGGSGSATSDRLVHELTSLRRSRHDRVVAGVCGGVAQRLGLDPLLVRILTAVLAVFGPGIVLYAAGWLLLPVDDGEPSVGEQMLRRRHARTSTSTVLLAVVLVIIVVSSMGFVFDRWVSPFLLTLAVIGLVVWALARDRRGEVPPVGAPAPPGAYPSHPASPPPTPAASPLSSAPPTPTQPPSGPPLTYPARTPTTATTSTTSTTSTTPTQHSSGPPLGPTWAVPASPPPAPPARVHSILFAVTMSLILIGLGTLKLVDLSGVRVVQGAYPALALTIIGVALLVGTWFGRSRGLITLGIVAAVLTTMAVANHSWNSQDGRTQVRVTPTSLSDLPTTAAYHAGVIRFDLSNLDFTGTSRSLAVQLGAGRLVVIVPPDVDVQVHGEVGVGRLDLFGRTSNRGLGNDETLTDLGDDGIGGGSLDLRLEAGVARVEVQRG